MKNLLCLSIVIILLPVDVHAQKIVAESNTVGDTVISALSTAGGIGIYGIGRYGVYGQANGVVGRGVYGQADGTQGFGVYGQADGFLGLGVYGQADGTDGRGVYGQADGNQGFGVYGQADGNGGRGVYGLTHNSNGYGVYGLNTQNHGSYFQGASGSADIVLAADDNTSDEGIIMTDPDFLSGSLRFISNDDVFIELDDDNSEGGVFQIQGHADTALFQVWESGNVFVGGTLVHSSDRNRKENVHAIDEAGILLKISSLPIYEWQFKGQDSRHIGPMAQDFHAAFHLGEDETTIASIDLDGVMLAAVKALYKMNQEQQAQIENLKQEIQSLRFENAVGSKRDR